MRVDSQNRIPSLQYALSHCAGPTRWDFCRGGRWENDAAWRSGAIHGGGFGCDCARWLARSRNKPFYAKNSWAVRVGAHNRRRGERGLRTYVAHEMRDQRHAGRRAFPRSRHARLAVCRFADAIFRGSAGGCCLCR